MGFSKQEYWNGLPFPPPGDRPDPGIKPRSPTLWVNSLPAEPHGKPKNSGEGSLSFLQQIFPIQGSNWSHKGSLRILESVAYPFFSRSSQSMDCGSPGFSVHGISQARILEWATISFSRGSSQPKDWTWVSHIVGRCFYCLSHQGSPKFFIIFCYCVQCLFPKTSVINISVH